jgi:hypothetical protein
MSILDNAVISLPILATTIRRASLARSRRTERCTAPKFWLSFRCPDRWLKGNDCLGTLRITGVGRALQVPSPDPDPHRCPWERFAPRQSFWFKSGDEGVPTVAVVTQNSKPKRQPSFFLLLSRAEHRCHWRMLSMAATTRLPGTPTPANAAPITCSCSGSTSVFRGPFTWSKNQPNRPCRPTRQAAGLPVSSQR